jgi:tetratricopeptide (TPR) repeat protein
MELDPEMLKGRIKEILRVTEASPLYVEDLVRFFAIVPPDRAIKEWAERKGDEARQYALGRELHLLSDNARQVLVAACIDTRPVSFPELEAVTGFSSETIASALSELQRLFLVPKPRLIEGEQRFDININTRALIKKQLAATDMYRRLQAARESIAGTMPDIRGKGSSIIRQAVFHLRNHEYENAENLLKEALRTYHNNRALIGYLGWVYKTWNPPRVTDARAQFNADEEMYKHWSRMESDEKEWTGAAEAAERGLQLIPDNRLLQFLAGAARSRLGRELAARFLHDRADKELRAGRALLEHALKDPQLLEVGEPYLNADIYRAIVLNCESLNDTRGLRQYFQRWRSEHPDDPDAASEWTRLSAKYGLHSLK